MRSSDQPPPTLSLDGPPRKSLQTKHLLFLLRLQSRSGNVSGVSQQVAQPTERRLPEEDKT